MRDLQVEHTSLKQEQNVKPTNNSKIIILADKYIHISVGPNYKELISGFCLLLFIETLLINFVFLQLQNPFHAKIGVILSITTPIFYLLTALKNPGIYNPNQCIQPKTNYCHICQHFKPKQIRHCEKCNICIEGYDHHCPWMSKCIGSKNVICFYIFLCSLTSLNGFVYYAIYQKFWANS